MFDVSRYDGQDVLTLRQAASLWEFIDPRQFNAGGPDFRLDDDAQSRLVCRLAFLVSGVKVGLLQITEPERQKFDILIEASSATRSALMAFAEAKRAMPAFLFEEVRGRPIVGKPQRHAGNALELMPRLPGESRTAPQPPRGTATGLPGRPPLSGPLIEAEIKRRIEFGEDLEPSITAQADALVQWLTKAHPRSIPPKNGKAVQNLIRPYYNPEKIKRGAAERAQERRT